MKKSVNIGMIIVIGAGILAASMLLPKTLLGRQRQQAFGEQTAVPVTEVHPYGEEYILVRKSMQESIRTMEKYDQDKQNLYQWQKLSDTDDNAKSAYEKLQEFMNLWDEDYWSEAEKNSVNVEGGFLPYAAEEPCDLTFFPYQIPLNEKLSYANELYFSPEYGIPVSGKIVMDQRVLQEKSTIPVADQIWTGLLRAYVQSVGIPFEKEQQSKDVTDDLYAKIEQDVAPEFKSENPKKEQYIYDSCGTFAAQSVDGTFEITAVMYEVSENTIGVVFSLNASNSVNE